MLTFRDNLLSSDPQAIRDLVAATQMFRANEIDVAVELVEECLAQGDASGYCFVVATEGEQVVGYACFGPITVTLYSYDFYWIVVHPSRQGQGIGRQLLQHAESRIQSRGGRQIY